MTPKPGSISTLTKTRNHFVNILTVMGRKIRILQ